MEKQENFKTLIRSLRVKRHEKLKISKPAFAVQKREGGEKDLVPSDSDPNSGRE